MKTFFKQPLFHFILAGALIFIAYALTEQPAPEVQAGGKVITVDRTDLLNFMQFRAQAFQPELFREQLDNMSPEEIESLVDAFVREEAMHREAMAMGMDQGDYIIRQRLVQKVEFLLENMVNQALEPEAGEIEAFYEARKDDYQIDAVYTFTHIFFDGEERGWEQARADADELMANPQLTEIAFNDASAYGDRYPFLQNYVERTRDFVVNNFTEEFVTALDAFTLSNGTWRGPLESRYGFHLVLLREKSAPRFPPLEDILGRVADDWRYESVLKARREAEDQVISGYSITVDLEAD